MSTIPPVAGASAPTPSSSASTGGLGKDDFLKLLVGQIQHQDPMQPADSQQWISQLTQYSVLEQLTNLNDASKHANAQSSTAQAVALLGRTVTWTGEDGAARTGVVDSVGFEAGAPTLTVAGQAGVNPAAVTEVR
jgi:flagellar basal-body rod modification protein FlgD